MGGARSEARDESGSEGAFSFALRSPLRCHRWLCSAASAARVAGHARRVVRLRLLVGDAVAARRPAASGGAGAGRRSRRRRPRRRGRHARWRR
eukprot:2819492-Pleurochrysis_carterae.AAC.1